MTETTEIPTLDMDALATYIRERIDVSEEDIKSILDLETQFLETNLLASMDEQDFQEIDGYELYAHLFHEAFNHPIATEPTVLPIDRATVRTIWTGQELVEYLAASASSREEFSKSFYEFTAGLEKQFKRSLDNNFDLSKAERLAHQKDALGDALYFIGGTCAEDGVPMGAILRLIHEANMSKLFTDEEGNKFVKYGEDNKVMKSPDFKAPDEDIIAYIQSLIK